MSKPQKSKRDRGREHVGLLSKEDHVHEWGRWHWHDWIAGSGEDRIVVDHGPQPLRFCSCGAEQTWEEWSVER